jgi:PBP1b-binding outer membrane lipoprotein LpoB
MKKSLFAFVVVLGFIGCAKEEPSVRYVDPNAQGAVAGTGVESQDISAAAQKAVQSILSNPAIANASQPPIVMITPVTNKSSSPIDVSLYTTKVRGALMQYGAGKVRFLARDVAAKTNEREQELRESGAVQGGQERKASSYDYLLTAELQGISASNSKGQSDYFLVSFKLVDSQDLLVWENQYEIKKEGRESSVYR